MVLLILDEKPGGRVARALITRERTVLQRRIWYHSVPRKALFPSAKHGWNGIFTLRLAACKPLFRERRFPLSNLGVRRSRACNSRTAASTASILVSFSSLKADLSACQVWRDWDKRSPIGSVQSARPLKFQKLKKSSVHLARDGATRL